MEFDSVGLVASAESLLTNQEVTFNWEASCNPSKLDYPANAKQGDLCKWVSNVVMSARRRELNCGFQQKWASITFWPRVEPTVPAGSGVGEMNSVSSA